MTTIPQNPPATRSLISRITSPFTAKSKNIPEFDIKLTEPYRHYGPGDVVKGSVVLTVTKPVRITHLLAGIRGYVKVYKNAVMPGQGTSKEAAIIGTGRGERGSEYFGNGFATIFEKELPLCGDGRLVPTVYSFEFELPIRSRDVPSSIDFERGTISYILTATLTRPTTISPVLTRVRHINVVETIDVARFRTPKPRVFSLEPLTRRSKPKHHRKSSDRDTAQQEDATYSEHPTSSFENVTVVPGSPVPSEISSASAISGSSVSCRVGNEAAMPNQGIDTQSVASMKADKTITAEAEVLRGACLPGDLIPVRIKIDHTKPIKSVHGIIITLYRQGHIDTYPPLPIGPRVPGQKLRYEEFYPVSRTGFGGLSLSSSGTVHQFRRDLAQTFAPLIVDPVKMTAVIQASIRVPDNVFPSITCVPGDIISFKYYVEVVIDLAGKLASQGRFFPRLTMTGVPTLYDYPAANQNFNSVFGNGQNITGSFADTDPIRREKSVVFCNFEITVGTRDSGRKSPKRPMVNQDDAIELGWPDQGDQVISEPNGYRDGVLSSMGPHPNDDGHINYDENNDEDYNYHPNDGTPSRLPQQFPLPEPEVPVDEKARLQRAEQYLLPSAPPLDDDVAGTSASHLSLQPSAPTLSDLENPHPHIEQPAPNYDDLSASSQLHAGTPADAGTVAGPSTASAPVDTDKQELERQRLLTLASSPDDGENEPDTTGTPSAPVLYEGDGYHSSNHRRSNSDYLPQYQR